MVHGLVDVGQECIGDQQIVNGHHDLVARNGAAQDLSTRGVIGSGDLAEDGELSRLARSDRTLHETATSDVCLFEGSQNFTSEYFEKESLSIARSVDLTDAARSSIRHIKFISCELKKVC